MYLLMRLRKSAFRMGFVIISFIPDSRQALRMAELSCPVSPTIGTAFLLFSFSHSRIQMAVSVPQR